MSIREGPWQSKNDHDFIIRSLRSGRRVDGRQLADMRLLRMVFARAEGQASAEIQLGRTRVLGVITGEVVPPFPDRPTEGFLHFNVELGPMASATGSGERNSPMSVEIARVIEISVRDSQALDTEALCIIGGEKVWQLRCDVHILDHGGNLIDACTLATMAALRHFRRPEVTIDGSRVVVHHTDEKEPHPLALHHVPICVTFAIFEDPGEEALGRVGSGGGGGGAGGGKEGRKDTAGMSKTGVSTSFTQHTAVDPTEAEEEVMKGRITFALTAHKELCALHKNGGVAMTRDTILGCARLASVKVEEIHKVLDGALAGADAKAALDRQSRLRGTASLASGPGPVPGMVRGKAPENLPGTKSTPFVLAQAPLPVAADALKVKHLGYDDLHVTQGIREEGLRGGGNRGGRGLDMTDARDTDLFAKMARAASMTEARIAQEDFGNGDGKIAAERLSPSSMSSRHRNGNADVVGGVENRSERLVRPIPGLADNRSEACNSKVLEQNKEVGETNQGEAAKSEFANLAASLQKQSVEKSKTPIAMDIDSDEEETVTLTGEFKTDSEALCAAEAPATIPSKIDTTDERSEDDDDLMSAVKRGKGRKGSKGKTKGKKGKTQ